MKSKIHSLGMPRSSALVAQPDFLRKKGRPSLMRWRKPAVAGILVLLLSVFGLVACSRRLPVQPTDTQVQEAVTDALIGLNRSTIICFGVGCGGHVIVKDGRVTLVGSVVSEADRLIAGETAKKVAGVREVINEMPVWPQATYTDSSGAVQLTIITNWPFEASPPSTTATPSPATPPPPPTTPPPTTQAATPAAILAAAAAELKQQPSPQPKAKQESQATEPLPRTLSGNFYADTDEKSEKWDFSSSGHFSHETINASRAWIAARRGAYVRNSEQGKYDISGSTLTLHVSSTVINVVDTQPRAIGIGSFATSRTDSTPTTRQCSLQLLGPHGESGIVLDGEKFNVRNGS